MAPWSIAFFFYVVNKLLISLPYSFLSLLMPFLIPSTPSHEDHVNTKPEEKPKAGISFHSLHFALELITCLSE